MAVNEQSIVFNWQRMKCLKILLIFVEFAVVLGIEPILIVHGGAGSVAAHRVIRNAKANIFKHFLVEE